ncbi:MAG: PepSY-associated TM helix domain-containing protein [Acidobacteria bacterium]|nr:PepSY-associated TM helix domain-containing protein [Acidobacteriota bacterium]
MSVLGKELMKWSRNLHIYVSLLGFTLFLFFALSGIQLTHESFGLDEAKATDQALSLPLKLAQQAQREQVLSHLKTGLGVERFEVREREIEISLMSPGQRAQVRIDRATGKGEIHREQRGWIGAMADLHKGAATGWVWRLLMDITCVWIVVSSITGFLMVLTLPKRKAWGLISVAAGTILAILAYVLIPVG